MTPLKKLQTRCGIVEYSVSGRGRPPIVLFNGAGMTLAGWRELYPAIESISTVVAWNRFGVEGSEPLQRMQTGAVIAASVGELLRHAGVEPPWFLVGHSIGALYAGLFARLHPAQTAGALMLAPADPQQVRAVDERAIERSLSKVQQRPADDFRDNLHAEVGAVDCLAQEIASAGPFPHVPLSVIEGGRGHFPQLDEPDVVLAELERLVRQSRRAASGSLCLPA